MGADGTNNGIANNDVSRALDIESRDMNKSLICPECGSEVLSNSEVCSNCGFPIGEYLIEHLNIKSYKQVNDEGNKTKEKNNNEDDEKPNSFKVVIAHKGVKVRCPECGMDTYSEDEMCESCGLPIKEYYEKMNKRTISEAFSKNKEDIYYVKNERKS